MEAQPAEAVMNSDFSSKPTGAAGTTANHAMLGRDPHTSGCDVVDNRTSLVARQFPGQQFLRRRAYARALRQAHEDAVALKVDRRI
jgi:hypothetical protein